MSCEEGTVQAQQSLNAVNGPNAGIKVLGPRIVTTSSSNPSTRAAVFAPSSCTLSVGSVGKDRTATRLSAGTNALSSSRRFPAKSAELKAIPVMLPPGRARLSTSPISTGCVTLAKTIGTELVTLFAARVADEPDVTITFTFNRTSCSASWGSCSNPPSVKRNSTMIFWPLTYPCSRNPCSKASSQALGSRPARRKPIVALGLLRADSVQAHAPIALPRTMMNSRRLSYYP